MTVHLRELPQAAGRRSNRLQAAKAAQAASKPPKADGEEGAGGLEDDSNEDLDPAQYRENRIKAIVNKKAKGVNPYPHKFEVSAGQGQQAGRPVGWQQGWEGKATRGRPLVQQSHGMRCLPVQQE